MTDFSLLYQKYAQDVFRFAYFLSGNQADAEDIVSEAFCALGTHPGQSGNPL
jgi:DNA-directed RNA polymerase specialized sigma24 family protein